MGNNYLPKLIQIRPQYKDADGIIHENVLWAEGSVTTNIPLADLVSIQGTFDTNWESFWKPVGASICFYIGSIVTDWTSNTGLQAGNSGFTPVAGTGSSTCAPKQTSMLVSLSDGSRYRGGHGRWYIPCLESGIAAADGKTLFGTVQSSEQTALTAWVTAMGAISGANGGPVAPVVFHQREQVVPHTTPPTFKPAFFTPIVSFTVDAELATQRRRLRKVAHH